MTMVATATDFTELSVVCGKFGLVSGALGAAQPALISTQAQGVVPPLRG